MTSKASKTIIFHETFTKSDKFPRDFLEKSRVLSPKRAFRTRLPPKVTRQVSKTSVSYETSSKSHTSSLQNERFVRDFLQKSHVMAPKRAFRTRLPQKLTNPNVTATFTSTTTHNLTIPCACHESFRVHSSNAHKVLRLPRKVTISSHVSFNKICTTPHVWNDFGPF